MSCTICRHDSLPRGWLLYQKRLLYCVSLRTRRSGGYLLVTRLCKTISCYVYYTENMFDRCNDSKFNVNVLGLWRKTLLHCTHTKSLTAHALKGLANSNTRGEKKTAGLRCDRWKGISTCLRRRPTVVQIQKIPVRARCSFFLQIGGPYTEIAEVGGT